MHHQKSCTTRNTADILQAEGDNIRRNLDPQEGIKNIGNSKKLGI